MDVKALDNLMQWWPKRLGEHAESVIDKLREAVFFGARFGDLCRTVNAAPHSSGDQAISLDEMANTRVRELSKDFGTEVGEKFGLQILTVGEEENQAFGSTAQIDAFSPGHLIVVADPLDGSTNCRTFGCGYSTVLVSFLVKPKGGYQLIGGAIADSNGYTVVWNGLENVFIRHHKMEKDEYRSLTKRQKPSPAIAAVATKPDRLREALARMEQIDPNISKTALLMTMAGTPSAFALCTLGLGMVIEPKAQKCWDAAHLYPALMLGLEARTLSTVEMPESEKIVVDQVTGYFGKYLDKFRHKPELIVPPFYIKN